MWQEARKQEKKLRCIMIDYKKRAERRQAYYMKMRMDPHQLMRIYGQKCKFHMLGENSNITNTDGQLMPWQGDPEILIDRFDVRAHLDLIPESKPVESESDEEEEKFERKCCYERYRTLVQIDGTGASEEQYLKQLAMEEEHGKKQAERADEYKKASKAKAKIHYKYEDSTVQSDEDNDSENEDDESDSDLSDIDIDVNVMELALEQKNELDALATQYGIGYGQYCKQLLLEKKEFEFVKRLQEEEEERSKMPGRRGKAARRTLRIKQKTLRGSPLSFAVQDSPTHDSESWERKDSTSSESSRSNSPFEEKVEFITEFGSEIPKVDESKSIKDNSPNTRPKEEHDSNKRLKRRSRSRSRSKHRSRRRSRSRSHGRHGSRSRDRHRSRSRSDERSRRRRHSRSRSHERSSRYSKSSRRSRSRSQSRSKDRHSSSRNRRSKSHSPVRRTLEHLKKVARSRSRSKSRDDKIRSKSRSRSRSKERRSRSKSPHESIAKRLSAETAKPATVDKSKLTPREKMKLRMQKMLNKQIKSDKKDEKKKNEVKVQEEEEREHQIFELSRNMRKNREREVKRRSPSPQGRMPSYDASQFRYKPRSRSRSSS